jgi:pimeloyl-ACP methyl ester carboxylesterase
MADFLSWSGAPWVIAGIVLAIAAGLVFGAGLLGRGVRGWIRGVGLLVGLLGGLMLAGATVSAIRLNAALSAAPAGGQEVVLSSGARLYVLCEGPEGAAPIIWLSGGYGQGYWMKPLHDRVKAERRSCLIDRPGVGRVPAGPMPRTVERVVDETHEALQLAGASGPYFIAGHSFGGLYAANLAAAYPSDVAGLMLLDPTPPGWFVEAVGLYGCPPAAGDPFLVLAAMFGLGYVDALNPLQSEGFAPIRGTFGTDFAVMLPFEVRPSSLVAQASALRAPCVDPFSIVRTPGALQRTPLLLMVQTRDATWAESAPPSLSERGQANWRRWADYQRTEYLAMSDQSRFVEAPEGATHYFPLLAQDATLDAINGFMASVEAAQPDASTP